MNTIYLQPQEYSALVVELAPDGADVAGYGDAPDAFFLFSLTDTERVMLAAALLRPGESVERTSGDVSEVRVTKKETGG